MDTATPLNSADSRFLSDQIRELTKALELACDCLDSLQRQIIAGHTRADAIVTRLIDLEAKWGDLE